MSSPWIRLCKLHEASVASMLALAAALACGAPLGCSAAPSSSPNAPADATEADAAGGQEGAPVDDAGTLPHVTLDGGTTTTPDGGNGERDAGRIDGSAKDGGAKEDGGDSADAQSDGTPPSHDGGADSAPPSTSVIEFAPYFPTWIWGGSGYAVTSLVDYQAKAGVNSVTIAFVLSGGGCKADQGIEGNLSDVNAFIAAGGHVKASFGGADGTYIESQCSDAASYAQALEDFVDATGITDLDFDIEQDPVLTDSVNEMRGQALALVQASKGVKVAFTLAANPSPGGGLTSQGLSVVSHAVSAGVKVSHVNFMTMDYGDSYGGSPLAPVVIGSLNDGSAQLMTLIPGLTQAEAWQMTGVIPMIGKNDDSEIFSLSDATTVANFAIDNTIGLVSFWSVDRDQVCESGEDYNSCSTVNIANFQFSKSLGAVTK